MRILVTDGNSRSALAVTRSLGLRGHEVYVSSSGCCSMAGISRHSAGEVRQAGAQASPEALASSIAAAAGRVEAELVFAVTDRTLTALHDAPPGLQPPMPPPGGEEYRRASDKVRLFRTCRRLGIPVPRGEEIPGGELPDEKLLAELGGELVVRPAVSWSYSGGGWVQGRVGVVRSLAELAERVATDPALAAPYLVQRRIHGDGCGLFLLADRGRLVEVFAHRRLREKPPWGGVSTLCVSVDPPPDLLDFARRFVEAQEWSGLAMLEFKEDARTGRSNLLEVNARPWGSLALALASGVDFPADVVELTRGRPCARSAEYRSGVRLRWWWGDVDHFYLQEKAKGRSGPGALLLGLGRAATAGPWPEAWSTFQAGDPLPAGLETLQWVRSLAS